MRNGCSDRLHRYFDGPKDLSFEELIGLFLGQINEELTPDILDEQQAIAQDVADMRRAAAICREIYGDITGKEEAISEANEEAAYGCMCAYTGSGVVPSPSEGTVGYVRSIGEAAQSGDWSPLTI